VGLPRKPGVRAYVLCISVRLIYYIDSKSKGHLWYGTYSRRAHAGVVLPEVFHKLLQHRKHGSISYV
jgi:hypothetical protein